MPQPNATTQDAAAAERADLADLRLRLALAVADLGTWDWDLVTDRVEWNDIHARLCGYAPGEFGGDAGDFFELVHPEDRDALRAAIERAKRSDAEFVYTYRLRRRGDGAVRWVNGRGVVFRDAAGLPRRLTGLLADVTEAREQAEALRAQEARFRAAFENAGTAKLLVAPGGHILEANAAAGVMLGYPGASLVALAFQRLVDADEQARGRDPLALLASRRRGEHRGEHRFVCRNGRRLLCDTAITSVVDAAGAPAFHAVELRDVTEQRRALDALRLSERRVALALASTEDVLWDWHVQTGEVHFGDQLARILGVEPGSIEPSVESWRRLIHPDDHAAVAAELAAHVDGRAARFGAEYRLRAAGDAWVWVLDRGMVVERDREGRALRALGMMRDITDRKRAELALRASQERYALIAHGTLDALWDWDIASDSMFLSPTTEAMLGHPPGALTGTKATEWLLLLHPEDTERVQASLQAHLERRTPHDLEFRVRHRDGHYRWFRGRGQAVWDAGGRPLRMAGALADVTARRAAEEASAASEARFRALLDAAPFGLALLDVAGRCSYTNARLLEILGRSRSELLDGGWLDAIDAGARTALLDRLAVYAAGARWGEPLELRLHAGAGVEERWVAVRAEALPGAEGVRDGDLLVFDDVTEARRLAAHLEHTQKLESIGVLAGGIAHDFNNLLVGILGNASLALGDTSAGSALADTVREIQTAAERAADLTRQLLAYAGKGRFVVEDVDLDGVVAEMRGLLATVVSKRAEVRLELAGGLPPIHADATQLRQLVMNLMTNASDALGGGPGTITVRTRLLSPHDRDAYRLTGGTKCPDGACVLLEVQDTGEGMSEETRRRIFDPFFTTKHTGRGLGLSALLGIVRSHGGAIGVESELGVGTTFRVMLPAAAGRAPHAPAVAAAEPVRGSGLAVVIDDEAAVRRVACRMLSRLGFEVVEAANGEEGLALCEQHAAAVRLVILDLTMPRLSGRETLAALRELGVGAPVVVSSGYTAHEIEAEVGLADIAGFVQKPFSVEQFTQAVRLATAPRARR